MMYLQIQESMMMILFYLLSFVLFASFSHSELVSLPGCPEKCGNLTIPFPFGLSPNSCFDDTFHIICNTSFEPPKAFLRLGSAEVVSISLDGKLEVLKSSSVLEEKDTESVPLVVEWAVGDTTCHTARNSASRYACQSSRSLCTDSRVGQGYVCHCLPGYQGNPYLLDGCQDIDECAISNPCEGVCINVVGSFKCYCPQGLIGDGRKDGTGCHPEVGTNWSAFPFLGKVSSYTSISKNTILGILAVVIVAPILIPKWITWPHRQKRLEKLREDCFEKNGGNLLRKKLRKSRKLRIFTAEDMKTITNNYDSTNVTLRCSPGTFFHGTLRDDGSNIEVSVVMIENVAQSQIKQFVDQLIFLSQPHRNLVRVLGCCLEKHNPLIVYEFHGNGNGTLFDCIHNRDIDSPFLRAMRVKAAAGVARGLAYLNGSRAIFMHGNICSANIVMDRTYDAKIFYAAGSNLIARDASSSDQENSVYRDPEPLNKKSDVYSFGVVLVELLTGGKTLSRSSGENGRNMVFDCIYLAKAGRLREILDQDMMDHADAQIARKIAFLAEWCLNVQPGKRPSMKEVAAKLSKLMQM